MIYVPTLEHGNEKKNPDIEKGQATIDAFTKELMHILTEYVPN